MPKKLRSKFLISFFTFALGFGFLTNISYVLGSEQCNVPGESDFSVGYDISFNFQESGQAQVSQRVTLTNLKTLCYAQKYNLNVASKKITDTSASDNLGGLPISTSVKDDATLITVKADANQQVVGVGKAHTIQINYTVDSFAIKRGRIWDVNIPQITTGDQVKDFAISFSVPKSFGAAGQISPAPATKSDETDRIRYSFGKESASSNGIGASFGDFQEFKFTLKYSYKNNNIYNVDIPFTLPPDTSYQAVYYQSLDPKPVSMSSDTDGNYLAHYNVKPGNNLEVVASGLVKIADGSSSLQTPIDWTNQDLSQFTRSDKYIDSENSDIQKKAKELSSVKDIYTFVVTTLKYDFTRLASKSLGRRGSITALKKPEQSICTDFTDLFVALARAKGIPARSLVGFGYSDNQELRPTKIEGVVNTTLLHAWPEYWDKDKKRWIQVDPTWAATTGGVDFFDRFDTNHFVFAINGMSSENPQPAGYFKSTPNQTDDIKIEFSQEDFKIIPEAEIAFKTDAVISGFLASRIVKVQNSTGRAIFQAKLSSTVDKIIGVNILEKQDLGILLPFSSQNIDLKLRSTSLIDSKSTELKLEIRGFDQNALYKKTVTEKVLVKPFFSLNLPQILLLVLIVILIIAWAEPKQRQKYQNKMTKTPWETK